MWVLPYTDQFSDTSWVSCDSVLFWYYLPGSRVRSHKLRAQPHKASPTSDASFKSLVVSCISKLSVINWGSQYSLLRYDNCRNGSQNSGKHISWLIIKDTLENTNDQPGEEIHRVRSGWILNPGVSTPAELSCATLLAHRRVHWPGSSLNPALLGFYGGFVTRYDRPLIQSPASLPFLEWGGRLERCKPPTWSHSEAHQELSY